MFSGYKFQLCQFHQVRTVKTKLTLHPKLEASKELLALSRLMCHTDKDMPWLWTWYDYPELNIPNTNNGLESLNSDLKAKLNLHR